MKSQKLIRYVIFFILSFVLISCKSNTENQSNSSQAVDTLNNKNNSRDSVIDYHFWVSHRDYSFKNRKQFAQDVKNARAKLDEEINRLEQTANSASGEVKDWYNRKISQLKDERNDIDAKWKGYDNTTKDNWDSFKEGIQNTWKDIEQTWNDVTSK